MSKIVYDVIQRFEVEDGIPRLVSTNIQVIQGGEDLMSLAIRLLSKLGFYDKFEENQTSQYIGFRLKNPGKGAKRYQIVLTQRKEGLCISIPKKVLQENILELTYDPLDGYVDDVDGLYEVYTKNILGRFWILPSKEDVVLKSFQSYYPNVLEGEVIGSFDLSIYLVFFDDEDEKPEWLEDFKIESLGGSSNYLILSEDKLFPYAWQVCISSRETLEEFLSHFAKKLMEQY